MNQNITFTKKNLNEAIENLATYTKEQNEESKKLKELEKSPRPYTQETDLKIKELQKIKDDLVRIIFVTSEAMRFGSYTKCFNHEKNSQKVEFENIPTNVQKILDGKIDPLKWKDYEHQLINGWRASSEELEQKRKEIFQDLRLFLNYFMLQNKAIKKLKKDKKKLSLNTEGLKIMYEEFLNIMKDEDASQELIKNWKKQLIQLENLFSSKIKKLKELEKSPRPYTQETDLKIKELEKEKEQLEQKITNLNNIIKREENSKERTFMLLWSIFIRMPKIVEKKDMWKRCHYDDKLSYSELNNIEGLSLLHITIFINNLDISKLLIWKQKEIINKPNKSGNTPLHVACSFNINDKK